LLRDLHPSRAKRCERTRSKALPFAASVDTLGSLFVELTSPLVAAAFEKRMTLTPRVSEDRDAARRERG
jgi:hypothetical protein